MNKFIIWDSRMEAWCIASDVVFRPKPLFKWKGTRDITKATVLTLREVVQFGLDDYGDEIILFPAQRR
jgi:hypothetical protein